MKTKTEKPETEYTIDQNLISIISKELAAFFLEEAEKKCKEILSVGDNLVNRSITLMTANVAILTAIVGFIINRYFSINGVDNIIRTGILVSIFDFILIIVISRNIIGKNYKITGASPIVLIDSKFINKNISQGQDYLDKLFIWVQIQNYQRSITFNEKQNNDRWNIFNCSIYVTMLIPILLILGFFMIK